MVALGLGDSPLPWDEGLGIYLSWTPTEASSFLEILGPGDWV